MRYLLAAITGLTTLILAAASFADAPAPDAKPTLQARSGNNCAAAYYPASAVRAGEQGATTLNVHIDATGKPTNVDIVASAGFADLDDAAKNCIMNGWHFGPAMQDGKAVASTKEYKIVWKLTASDAAPQLLESVEPACESLFFDASNRWTHYQSATLQFRISATGAVVQPFVASPSGDRLFDAKAVQCAARLKYKPTVVNDVANEISWSSAVRWSPRTGLAYTDGYGLGLFCADTLFPANIWSGDPPDGTIVSFHVVQGGAVAEPAIERSSGNTALDQAALQCVGDWKFPFANSTESAADFAEVVRFNWKNGHAFILGNEWK